MSTTEGPTVTISRSCRDCRYMTCQSYRLQGDSGHLVFCVHPTIGSKYIGDTTWSTPDWCPFLATSAQRYANETKTPTGGNR